MKKQFIAEQARDLLKENNLDNLASIMQRKMPNLDDENVRGKGTSKVSCVWLNDKNRPEKKVTVYIKRQKNYLCRSWKHPLGISVLLREVENILALQAKNIPVIRILAYFSGRFQGAQCAALITLGLDDYISLESLLLEQWQAYELPQKKQLITCLAKAIRDLHQAGYQHGCLYPKHIYVHKTDPSNMCFIDLESVRKVKTEQAIQRDLDSFGRRFNDASASLRLYFLLSYLQSERVDQQVRLIWTDLLRRYQLKQKKHRA